MISVAVLSLNLIALFVCSCKGQNVNTITSSGANTLTPLTTLDLPAFLGRWYLMYTSQIPLDTYLKDAVCVVSDVSLITEEMKMTFEPTDYVRLKEVLSFNKGTPTGALNQFESTHVNNAFLSTPGKWMSYFQGQQTLVYILAVGDVAVAEPLPDPLKELPKTSPKRNLNHIPKPSDTESKTRIDPLYGGTEAGEYPWAIGSDASGTMLYIVARDVTEFQQKYEQIVLQKAASLGFVSSTNKPVKVEQSEECMYPPKSVTVSTS